MLISFTGETQIIDDDPKFEPEELAKDGIHMVTLEETSQLGLDEASQMSMNEPLVFNRPTATALLLSADMDIEDSNSRNITEPSSEQSELCIQKEATKAENETSMSIPTSKESEKDISDSVAQSDKNVEANKNTTPEQIPIPVSMPMPENRPITPESIPVPTVSKSDPQDITNDESGELQDSPKNIANNIETITEIDLADIPQPPPSPTESEKNRRQEELDDLAMLGIDADDMAAQCM